ncbi:hypothetical protein SAMN05421740_103204 [Parapedobacter koreensis]|uniref:Uncharacterized protein n=1 Tax=Parapedobacter koreensis TaxID=332977 RepID=A0A1H7LLX0_9SPHI|nr:hypothetical protein SAMN05421740_103204 [Parapedobacter koreensis]
MQYECHKKSLSLSRNKRNKSMRLISTRIAFVYRDRA